MIRELPKIPVDKKIDELNKQTNLKYPLRNKKNKNEAINSNKNLKTYKKNLRENDDENKWKVFKSNNYFETNFSYNSINNNEPILNKNDNLKNIIDLFENNKNYKFSNNEYSYLSDTENVIKLINSMKNKFKNIKEDIKKLKNKNENLIIKNKNLKKENESLSKELFNYDNIVDHLIKEENQLKINFENLLDYRNKNNEILNKIKNENKELLQNNKVLTIDKQVLRELINEIIYEKANNKFLNYLDN